MDSPIVEMDATQWQGLQARPEWTAALEAGKVLFFPHLGFALSPEEKALLREDMLKPGKRNVSLDADAVLNHAAAAPPSNRRSRR